MKAKETVEERGSMSLLPSADDKLTPATILTGRFGRSSVINVIGDSEEFTKDILESYKETPFYRVTATSPVEISDSVNHGLFSVLVTIEHWDYISPMCIPFPKNTERCRLTVIESRMFGGNDES